MIRIIACGHVKEKWMRQGIEEYAKRIQPYEKLQIVEVEDEKAPAQNSDAENELIKKTEGERLLHQIHPGEYVILLDLAGQEIDSVGLSKQIEKIHLNGKNHIDFVIGGSLGLSPEVIKHANIRWKISSCTFPHQLCRLIVLEQIYRAFRILHNEPYHK